MSAQIKTQKIGGGIDYAPVDERVRAFHKAHGNGSIRTATNLVGDKMIEAKATVYLDVSNLERYFTGSALGQVGREKAFEKLETVAVGRALAFAGFLADGRIASAEEMERFEQNTAVEPVAPESEPVSETITAHTLKLLNTVGTDMYGEEWDFKRPELVKAKTKGRTTSSKELTEAEGSALAAVLKKKNEERKAQADADLAKIEEVF